MDSFSHVDGDPADLYVRRHTRKLLGETSHGKSLGDDALILGESGLQSSSPLAESTCTRQAADQVEKTEDEVFIFLSGHVGYPIQIKDAGEELAAEA